MQLKILLASLGVTLKTEIDILGLANDSRMVKAGDMFLAYPGALVDGRDFALDALNRGAASILYEPINANAVLLSLPNAFGVPHLAEKMAGIAAFFYGEPSRDLQMVGVTGTNGKTSIAYQLAQAYALLGVSSAYIGTLGAGPVQSLRALSNTTPDGLCLQTLLANYKTEKIRAVAMEVSSHALALHRVDHIAFDTAIFTNLTQDHLDFHGTMEAYGAAKAALFQTAGLKRAILNADSPFTPTLQSLIAKACTVYTYGFSPESDVCIKTWETHALGTTMYIHSPWGNFEAHYSGVGRFNADNALALLTTLLAEERAPVKVIVDVLSQLKAAPGRLEVVARHPHVIVDFAHTPDALESVLSTLRALNPARLWVVFGCGGDRDKKKRPLMGGIAARYADELILTNDNPRTEQPEVILAEIQKGIPNMVTPTCILDRKAAIIHALTHATANDMILIAGKGHEDYQIIGTTKHPFSDQAVVYEWLNL